MSRRMWVLAVAAWVGVVIAGSGVTWLAIDRAGQQVTGSPLGASTTQPAVVGTVGPAPKPSPKRPHKPPATASPTGQQTSPTATPSATGEPTVRPPATGPSQENTSPAPAAHTETRTWSGAAGSVTVSCTGGLARLKGASPSNGWSIERGDTSGDNIEVKFENGESEVQVRATCVGGVPQFHVQTGSSTDSAGEP